MAMPFGRNSFIKVGKESTAGTAVSRTHSFRVQSANIQRNATRAPVPVLYQGGGASHRFEVQTQEMIGGGTEIPLSYTGVGLLLEAALGSSATTGTGPYVHTYTMAAALPSYTVEEQKGTGSSEVFAGCKVGSLEIGAEAGGGVLAMAIEWMGMTSGGEASAATPSFGSSGSWVQAWHSGTLAWNSGTYALRSFRFKLDNKLEETRNVGSKTASSIDRSDFAEATLELEIYDDSGAFLAALHAGTASDAVLELTDGTSSIQFTLESATVQSTDMPISTAGKLVRRATFKGFSDGTNEAIKIVVGNSQSTATAV